MKKIEILSPEEEARLWEACKTRGDERARAKLIQSYQPLVFKQATPYRGSEHVMDVIQEGTVGLIEAVESFNPTRGVAFSLFAVHRIRGRMKDFLKKEGASDAPCIDGMMDAEGVPMRERIVDTPRFPMSRRSKTYSRRGCGRRWRDCRKKSGSFWKKFISRAAESTAWPTSCI